MPAVYQNGKIDGWDVRDWYKAYQSATQNNRKLRDKLILLEDVAKKSSLWIQQRKLSHYDMEAIEYADALYELQVEIEDALAKLENTNEQ